MILPDWMSEERPVVTKVGRNNFLIRNRHHLEALLQKFETHPLKVASVFHPTAKVLLLFFLLVLVGISRNLIVLWIVFRSWRGFFTAFCFSKNFEKNCSVVDLPFSSLSTTSLT